MPWWVVSTDWIKRSCLMPTLTSILSGITPCATKSGRLQSLTASSSKNRILQTAGWLWHSFVKQLLTAYKPIYSNSSSKAWPVIAGRTPKRAYRMAFSCHVRCQKNINWTEKCVAINFNIVVTSVTQTVNSARSQSILLLHEMEWQAVKKCSVPHRLHHWHFILMF